jgi:hypothetical protein
LVWESDDQSEPAERLRASEDRQVEVTEDEEVLVVDDALVRRKPNALRPVGLWNDRRLRWRGCDETKRKLVVHGAACDTSERHGE